MHDPFQTYATMGVPYNVPQTSGINPLAGIHPLTAAALGLSAGIPTNINPITGVLQTGQQGYGSYPAQNFINSQQLQQVAAALASQAAVPQLPGLSSLTGGLQNPGLQNPVIAALLTNPWVAAGLQAQFGQQPHSLYSQFGQIGSPLGQGVPTAGFGYPLAPQSWVGQGSQFGGGYGQVHPLIAQLTARALQGNSPWGY